jgi:legumain
MIYYLEACESGSMFLDLKPNTGIYGLSAADPTESSWGYYCPPDDRVFGKSLGSCLGDHFSINWMEDTETGDLNRSLREHF